MNEVSFRWKYFLLSTMLFLFLSLNGVAKTKITGQFNIDSTWAPVIYFSLIPDFDELNSMSNQMIFDKSEMDDQGNFSFETSYLPVENYLYRIHISKKGDPPASLIIGGKDENHIFLVANKYAAFSIKNSNSEILFGNIEISNSVQNQLLNKINEMVLFVDTANFNSTSLKRELMESALGEELRQFADTCSFPLVALYAIYKSNFEQNAVDNSNYYHRFLEKWKDEKSPYFEEFRKSIQIKKENYNSSFLFGIAGLVIGILLTVFLIKRNPKKLNPTLDLTLQERKIFALLQKEKSNKEISDELNISLSTVKSHVNNIFSKLNIKSRREVV